MPEVASAFIAHGFNPAHADTRIIQVTNHLVACRPVKRRPTRSGIELVGRIEQGFTTALAYIFSNPEVVIVVAAKRRLGALFSAYPIFFCAQLAAPLFIVTH
jgi:hypothetical protein